MAKSRTFFDSVDLKVDFPTAEKKLLHDWDEQGVVKKYLNCNKKSKSFFSFLDGPITANNSMGVHHAWGRMYKDLWQRFKNMQGYRQRFQNGFDCQGLWVEVEVEKELGFKNKKDIEKFGVAKFVQLCRDRVKKYSGIQTEQSKRLGYFMDWDNSYYTLSEDNNYMIWHFLKICDDLGWIYKGNDVVPWCPRCETAISEHEILTEDYKEVTHESVFLSFPIVGQPDENLLAWTTTPWTVPANIALAIDADTEYSLMEINGKKYWVAKGARDRVFAGVKAKELKVTRGTKLIGLRYIGAFDTLPAVKSGTSKNDKFHTVCATDPLILPISTEEGTGIVHTSTGTGAEDHRFGKKIGLPIVAAIDDTANYLNGFGFLSGKNAKNDPNLVIDYLKEFEGGKFLYKTMNYKHRYPTCWRCKTELVWKITDEWYIGMDTPGKLKANSEKLKVTDWGEEDEKQKPPDTRTLRERMKTVAEKINWIPAFGLDREMDWLTNMHDWLISKKNRYWGLALPIWECKKCHHFEVFGSKEELKERATEGWKEFDGKSPHKPQIDSVKIKCSHCGAITSRIEPVGNPWLDAGIVPFSTISENNKACGFEVDKTKPLYLTDREGWQKWFPADFITESFPGQFKNWFYAMIAMSTVLEDVLPMKTVLGFATMVDSHGRGFHKSLGNSIEFIEGADKAGADVIRWMCARQNPAENLQFGYELANEVRRKFHLKLWNIYNFFVTYANLDGWVPGSRRKPGKPANILDKWILVRLNQTVCQVSGFLEKFDAVGASGEIEKFVDNFSLWYIRRSRDRVGPAKESEQDSNAFYLTTHYTLLTLCKIMAPFTPFIADAIYTNLTKEDSVHLADWPDFTEVSSGMPEADRKLIEEMDKIREIVEKIHAKRKESGIPVRQPLAKAKVYCQNVKISKDIVNLACTELNIKNILFLGGSDKIELDTKITPELKEESEVRELVRSIQEDRKKLGLNLTQKVNVTLEKVPTKLELVEWMMKKAQIANLKKGKYKVTRHP